MTQQKTTLATATIALFMVGIVVAIAFQTIYTWGVIEGTQFDRNDPGLQVADQPVDSFRCPLIVTTGEVGIVSASFTNPTEMVRPRIVRTNISDGFIIARREMATNLSLAPGETQTLTWEVTTDDAVWNRFIIVRVFAVRSAASMPAQVSTCSIIAVNAPGIPGSWLATALLALGIFGSVGGLAGWVWVKRPLSYEENRHAKRMGLILTLVLFGLFISLAGYWIASIGILMLSLFLIVNIGLAHFDLL